MNWILLVLLYGLLKGAREIAKKKAMEINSVMEVLVAYTVLSFIMVIPQARNAGGLELKYYFLIAVKSFCMFIAWICSFNSLKKLPVSLFGILSLSRVLFATLLGVLFLHEEMGILQIFGLVFCLFLPIMQHILIPKKFNPLNVIQNRKTNRLQISEENKIKNDAGGQNNGEILQLSFISADNQQKTGAVFVILAFISCIMNSLSGFMDKILMKNITSSQLQFWYMLFIVLYYSVYIIIKREKISLSVIKNKWVMLLAVMFVIGDKALFIANGNPQSKVTVMTLIKQSACLVTIIGGKLIFNEKNITYKLFCAAIIIFGIVLGIL